MENNTMNVYEKCPTLENDNLIIRLIEKNDADDLMSVYNDKFVLPFLTATIAMAVIFIVPLKRIWRTQ